MGPQIHSRLLCTTRASSNPASAIGGARTHNSALPVGACTGAYTTSAARTFGGRSAVALRAAVAFIRGVRGDGEEEVQAHAREEREELRELLARDAPRRTEHGKEGGEGEVRRGAVAVQPGVRGIRGRLGNEKKGGGKARRGRYDAASWTVRNKGVKAPARLITRDASYLKKSPVRVSTASVLRVGSGSHGARRSRSAGSTVGVGIGAAAPPCVRSLSLTGLGAPAPFVAPAPVPAVACAPAPAIACFAAICIALRSSSALIAAWRRRGESVLLDGGERVRGDARDEGEERPAEEGVLRAHGGGRGTCAKGE
ncbi:hypothetical protein FB451DRAFT_1453405 [Mycena latifolia]|nr:hypothetical protein FB451DRAFT_1453405 [Mycena latifolia]